MSRVWRPGAATELEMGASDRDLDTQDARASGPWLVSPEATAAANQGGTAVRIALRPHDPRTGEAIAKSQVVKGYEYDRGQFVTFTAAELKALDVESSNVIDLEMFVARGDIDPVYFDNPYYLYPDGPIAVEALRVIGVAMAEAGLVGIGRLTLSRRERTIMVEPRGTGMALFTLRAADEVRPAQFAGAEGDPDTEMVAIARAIIRQRTGQFDPSTYRDRYQAALRGLIEAKLKGLPIKPREVIAPPPVIDLMAALKRSLAQEMPLTDAPSAKARRGKAIADRRQRSLLLPVAGGRKRKDRTATEPPAIAVRPRKKA
ncbi:MAG: Ku protein [Rhizobiales bacterium]|nr:Ku protein [Hyphomicrobiales bacterium]